MNFSKVEGYKINVKKISSVSLPEHETSEINLKRQFHL